MTNVLQSGSYAFAVVFALLVFLCYRKALPQPLRPLQIVMPLVAVAYSIVLVLSQSALLKLLSNGLNALSDSNQAVISALANGANDITNYWLIAIAAAAVFLIVKLIVLGVFKAIEKSMPNTLLNYFEGLYSFAFEWNEAGGMWSIKDEYCALGKLASKLYYVVLVVCFLLMCLFSSAITLYLPCCVLLIFGEIACFLSAPQCDAVKTSGSIDYKDGSTRIANYDRLMDDYKKYDNRIVTLDKEIGRRDRQTANHNIVTPLIESESIEDNLAGQYLKSLQLMGEDLDDDKAYMLQRLLHGENIVCASPFYWDFGRYILFPLVRALSHGGKAMVLCGSDIRIEDVKSWLEKEIGFVSGVEGLWRVGLLFDCDNDDYIDICCMKVNDANRQNELQDHADFLAQTRFVLLLNPSTSFSSAQIGLGLLARALGDGHHVTYCICDKNTNGLVDSLSHALRANFVEVECPRVPEGTVCSVVWRAEDPNGISMHHELFGGIAQYLGLGTEIAAIAAKNGISNITWTGQENVPLQDMRWIAQQYYRKICSYAKLDASAAALDNCIGYKNGMWDSQAEDHAFYVVEDEGANAFEVLRRFSSRGQEDSFINVICPNYLLRDYMSDNARLFLADPKAIPHIIPDYANTLRNNALSLFARLSCGPVEEEEVRKTLLLAGLGIEDIPGTLAVLAETYLDSEGKFDNLRTSITCEELLTGIDPETLRYKCKRFIRLSKGHPLEDECKRILAQSFYVCEDEELNKNVLGSCLTGHMYQIALPGQGIVLEGKYYEVLSVGKEDGNDRVLLRRAADHFDKRKHYVQIKDACIDRWQPNNCLNRTRQYASLLFEIAEADVLVSTFGYLEMQDMSDFRNARFIQLSAIPQRAYRNKNVLKISFGDESGATPEIIATITVLLNALFRTIYNENAKFLMVGSHFAQESDFPRGSYTVLNSDNLDENAIYVLEDSDLDLGLIDSIDRNMIKFLGILEDYLSWHVERLNREYIEEEEEEEPEFILNIPDEVFDMIVTVARRSLRKRIKDFFLGIGHKGHRPDLGIVEEKKRKKRKTEKEDSEKEPEKPASSESASDAEGEPEKSSEESNSSKEASGADMESASTNQEASDNGKDKATSLASIQLFPKTIRAKMQVAGARVSSNVKDGNSNNAEEKDRYKRENYLMFGNMTYPQHLSVEDTISFLDGLGIRSADLHQAREDSKKKKIEADVLPEDVHICDFCGEPILDLEYDVLDDGRERCMRCTREAITSLDEFNRVYAEVKKTMCQLYQIALPASLNIKMTTAEEISRHTGSRFVATAGFDARAVGVAINSGRNSYTLLIESGVPRISAVGTLAHELTHIWQYENWSKRKIEAEYGLNNELAIYEGMAVWSEIQYLFATNNRTIAVKRLLNEIVRNDVYGAGLRAYYKKYGLNLRPCSTFEDDHPFSHGMNPL